MLLAAKKKIFLHGKYSCVGNAVDGFYWANVSKVYNLLEKIIMIIIDE